MESELLNCSFQQIRAKLDHLLKEEKSVKEKVKNSYCDIYPHIVKICLHLKENDEHRSCVVEQISALKSWFVNTTTIAATDSAGNEGTAIHDVDMTQYMDYLLTVKLPFHVAHQLHLEAALVVLVCDFLLTCHAGQQLGSAATAEVERLLAILNSSRTVIKNKIRQLFSTQNLSESTSFDYLRAYVVVSEPNLSELLDVFLASKKDYFLELNEAESVCVGVRVLSDAVKILIDVPNLSALFSATCESEHHFCGVFSFSERECFAGLDDDIVILRDKMPQFTEFCDARQRRVLPVDAGVVNDKLEAWLEDCRLVFQQALPRVMDGFCSFSDLCQSLMLEEGIIEKLVGRYKFVVTTIDHCFVVRCRSLLHQQLTEVFQAFDSCFQAGRGFGGSYRNVWSSQTCESIVHSVVHTSDRSSVQALVGDWSDNEFREATNDLIGFTKNVVLLSEKLPSVYACSDHIMVSLFTEALAAVFEEFVAGWRLDAEIKQLSPREESEPVDINRIQSSVRYVCLLKRLLKRLNPILGLSPTHMLFIPNDPIIIWFRLISNQFSAKYRTYISELLNPSVLTPFRSLNLPPTDDSAASSGAHVPARITDTLADLLLDLSHKLYDTVICAQYPRSTLSQCSTFIGDHIMTILDEFVRSEQHRDMLLHPLIQLLFDVKCVTMLFLQDTSEASDTTRSVWKRLISPLELDAAVIERLLEHSASIHVPTIMYLVEPILTLTAISTIRELWKQGPLQEVVASQTLPISPISQDHIVFISNNVNSVDYLVTK